MVTLPRRAVHVGIWLRLLRTLLDEVSMATSRVGTRSAATLAKVWDAVGHPARAGLNVWKPYEQLDSTHQRAMLEAAATALALAEAGTITARGTLGPLLTREPYQPADPGDPAAYWWKREQEEASAVIAKARTDQATAWRILAMFTVSCRTLASFNRERDYFIRIGIPAGFLPSAQGLGRTDLA